MSNLEILRHIAADAERGELAFNTSAVVALKVRQALNDPDCQSTDAARLIRAEPLLSARVVAVANSAAFRRPGRMITDVRTAVTFLGFPMIRALAMAMVVHQMAGKSNSTTHQRLAKQLWEHSAHVAALAFLIAQRVTQQDPETAMFAGMIHEIGGFYLLSRAKDYPGLLDGELREWVAEDGEDAAEQNSPESTVGRAVLKALSVPESVFAAIETLWKGYLCFPPTTLGDTLLLADHLAPVKSPWWQIPSTKGEEITAKIDMVIGQNTLAEILEQSAEEVNSLTEALQV